MASAVKKFGIVGIGFGQAVLVPALRMVDGCEPALLCASEKDRACTIAGKLGVERATGDWRDVVADQDIDAVCIAVPPALQPDIAVACLEAGKPVFCEKPLAADLAGAMRIADAARASGLACMTDFEFAEIPAWLAAHKLMRDGTCGALRHAHVSWQVETYANRRGLSSWKTDPAQGGGALCAFASHTLHALEWFCGPIARMSANLHKSVRDMRPGETLVQLHAAFYAGGAASAVIGTDSPGGTGHRLEFYGDEGALVLDNPGGDYISGFSLSGTRRKDDALVPMGGEDGLEDNMAQWRGTEEKPRDGRLLAAASLLHKFSGWVGGGVPAAPSAEHGLRVQELIEAARASHETGAWVDVKPPRIP